MTVSECPNEGYVYILTNPCFKEHLIKIGMTKREADIRAKELYRYNTALPHPFKVFAIFKTKKYKEVERFIHKTLDNITDSRVNQNREFFDIDPYIILNLLKDLADLLEEAHPVLCKEAEEELQNADINAEQSCIVNNEVSKRGPKFTFSSLGIRVGEELEYRCSQDNQPEPKEGLEQFDASHKITVVTDKKIEYNDNRYSLTGFITVFSAWKKSFYDLFFYKGKSLREIKKCINEDNTQSEE